MNSIFKTFHLTYKDQSRRRSLKESLDYDNYEVISEFKGQFVCNHDNIDMLHLLLTHASTGVIGKMYI